MVVTYNVENYIRPPRQTALYVDYVEKAGLVDYCTVQQDDDLLGPRE